MAQLKVSKGAAPASSCNRLSTLSSGSPVLSVPDGGALDAALIYSNWVFGGALLVWLIMRAKLGEAGKYRVRYIEKMSSPFSQFMGGFAGSRIGAAWLKDSDFARALLARSLPEMEAQLRFVEDAVKDRNGAPVKALAYCFCGL